jgi:DNA-binding transcriptional LysR family regulator
VQAIVTDRFVQLGEENVDVVLRIGAVRDTRAVARKLRAHKWITAASPSYLAKNGTPTRPEDLVRHNCLKFVLTSGREQEWSFAGGNQPATGNLTADSGEALVAAARAGLGVIQAHDFMVADAIARGDLVEVLAPHATAGPPMAVLAAPGRNTSPKVRAFIAFIVEIFGG